MTPRRVFGRSRRACRADIPLVGDVDTRDLSWLVNLDYSDLALTKPIEGQLVSEAVGNITVDPRQGGDQGQGQAEWRAGRDRDGRADRQGDLKRSRDISIVLDDEAREEIAPGLGLLVQGPIKVSLASGEGASDEIKADLTNAKLDLPWVGWSKGPGIAAAVEFSLVKTDDGPTKLTGFKLDGKSFAISGDVTLVEGELTSAEFSSVQLNRGDDVRVSIDREGKGFDISIAGDALDVRSIIKLLKREGTGDEESGSNRPISIKAKIGRLNGFHDEAISDVTLSYIGTDSTVGAARFSGKASSGAAVSMQDQTEEGMRQLQMELTDAGAVLRFLDIYKHMAGGKIKFVLSGPADGILTGQVDTSNFEVIDEQKLRSLVASASARAGDGRGLNEVVKREIDTSRVTFERGYAMIAKGNGAVELKNGVLRGPTIGSTFQGTLYDKDGNMDMTGTFMPAYGLNRIFGELPLVGMILGNGRDRGLIGVTFKLTGDADEPTLTINPLSVIAPGIFRSIFEFR